MEEKLYEDLKKAMKNGNTIEKSTIQLIRAELLKKQKEKQCSLTDAEIESIVAKEKKSRLEAIAMFEKAGRQDLMETAYKELEVISRYLPKVMSENELDLALDELFSDVKTRTYNFGQLMGMIKAKYGNRVDMKMVSDKIKNRLG